MEGFAGRQWPVHSVDLTEIALVYPRNYGAPYVLGLFAGGPGEGKEQVGASGCRQYVSVHRWDNEVGAFRRVDATTSDVVLRYFYTAIEGPCETAEDCEALLPWRMKLAG